jgi:hypothetical protein
VPNGLGCWSERMIASWNNTANNCVASNRNHNTPDNRNYNMGFRLRVD